MNLKRKITSTILTVLLTLPLISPLFSKDAPLEYEEKLHNLIVSACPESKVAYQEERLSSLIRRIPNRSNWEKAVEPVIYRACFLEYRSWLSGHAFNLAFYGVTKGLKKETLERLTELMSIQTLGKTDYLTMGDIWEKMDKANVSEGEIDGFMQFALKKRFRGEAMEALAIIYMQFRGEGLEHMDAIQKSVDKINTSKSLKNHEAMLLVALFEEPPEDIKTVDWEKEKNNFWRKARARDQKIKYEWRSKPLDEESLKAFVAKWEGATYLYGGDSRRGIDSANFVIAAVKNQNKNVTLPEYVADLAELGRNVNMSSLMPGDFVYFSSSVKRNRITDVGIYLGQGEFAHVTVERGVTRSNLNDEYYKKRFMMGRRLY